MYFLPIKLTRSLLVNGEKGKKVEVWKRVHLATTSHLRSPGCEAVVLKGIHLFFIVKKQNTERSVLLHLDLGTQRCGMQKGDSVRRAPGRERSHAGDTQAIFGLKEVLN